ncbi:hypothetical protein GBF48_02820 [Salmonella enterica subsp. enterica]|nr:hypothetical protein [Salmonella enterica subsp. enterica serovar Pensacola]
MTFNNNDKMFVSILLGLVLIYTFPLLTQQSYYIDDLGRSLYGGLGWSGNGRPLADLIFYVINFGIPITDSSPLPLILGLTALVISLVYIRDYLFGNDYITAALCFMMIIANPFFIENLSYKYDSLTMCLSVAISIMASRKSYSREISNIIIAVTLTIAYLSLYQASLNIYSIFLFTFILSDITSGEDLKSIVYKAISSLFCLITGYLIYSFFIAKKLVTGGYNIEHSKIIELNSNIIESLYNNIASFYKMISVIFDGAYSLVYYSMLVVLVVSFLIIALRILSSEQNKAIKITFLAVSLLASLFFIIGPMLLLNSPIYAARVLIGMGGFMFFCCYSMYSAFGDKKLICRIYFSFVLLISTFFSYGAYNSINAQFKFEENIVNRISQDIQAFGIGNNAEYIKFIGVEPYTSTNENIIKKHPIMEILIPRIINNDWMWSGVLMQRNPFSKKFKLYTNQVTLNDGWEKSRNDVYSIGLVGETIVVRFN